MSEGKPLKTKASDWEDWKNTCAYLGCSDEAMARLGDFGVNRMLGRLNDLGETRGPILIKKFLSGNEPKSVEAKKTAWQWLDIHIIKKDDRGGTRIGGAKERKPCKDWLFDKDGLSTVEEIERYFSRGFCRAAAQEYAKETLDFSPIDFSQSIDLPVGVSEDSPSLRDLIPDEVVDASQSLEIEEFMDFLIAVSEKEFKEFKDVTKVALLGSALRISMENEEIKRLTGKGKSALYDHVKRANGKVLDAVEDNERHAEFDANEGIIDMIVEKSLEKFAEKWGRNPENPASVLFEVV